MYIAQHLTYEQRYTIEQLWLKNYKKKDISTSIGKKNSTPSHRAMEKSLQPMRKLVKTLKSLSISAPLSLLGNEERTKCSKGLIRQYIRKNQDFTKLTGEYVQYVKKKLNQRPRKRCNFENPIYLMNQLFL